MIPKGIRVVVIWCAVIPLLCAGSWNRDGKPMPDNSWAKSDGDFGVQLVLTDKPDELFAAWEKPGPAAIVSETASVVRGKPIVGVVFFAGCAPDARGLCEATLRFTMSGPDGKLYGKAQNGELWIGKAPPSKGQMQLSVGNIGAIIEPKDTLGTYTVVAEILDKVSKKILVLKRTFEAVEAVEKKLGKP